MQSFTILTFNMGPCRVFSKSKFSWKNAQECQDPFARVTAILEKPKHTDVIQISKDYLDAKVMQMRTTMRKWLDLKLLLKKESCIL